MEKEILLSPIVEDLTPFSRPEMKHFLGDIIKKLDNEASRAILFKKLGEDEEILRSDIIQAIYNLNGKPLNFYYFPFWLDIINSPRLSLMTPKENRRRVLKTSRQVAKSTNGGIEVITDCLIHKNFTYIVALPTDRQVQKFSIMNIKTLNMTNVITERLYFNPKLNQRQIKLISYSTNSRIMIVNIYNTTVSSRGIPGDAVLFDEYQSIPEGNAEIVENALNRSKYRKITYSGTPLEEDNPIEKRWKESTQTEWAVKCKICGHWNVNLGIKNIGKKGLICEKCHHRIYAREGEWVDAYPDAPIEGFHINELMVPPEFDRSSPWKEIIRKYKKNPNIFMNEVLGESIKMGRHPITEQMVANACNSNRLYVKRIDQITDEMRMNAIAGLDWALETSEGRVEDNIKSYTMLVIGGYDFFSKKTKIWFVKKYYDFLYENDDDPDFVVKDIARWLTAFNVKVVGADFGAGHKENQRLRKYLPLDENGLSRLLELEYVSMHNDFIYYDVITNKFIVDRTFAMDKVVEEIKDVRYEFARYNGETSNYVRDLTTVYTVNDRYLRRKRYGKKDPDDFFQALVFMELAKQIYYRMITIKEKNIE